MQLNELLACDRRALGAAFSTGNPVTTLARKRFRGVTLGLPPVAIALSWRLFAKEVDGDVGWNVKVVQPPDEEPATLETFPLQAQKTWAPFDVGPAPAGGVWLDYRKRNWFPVSLVVDPVRDVGDGWLLGVTELGPLRLPLWFAMREEGEVGARPAFL